MIRLLWVVLAMFAVACGATRGPLGSADGGAGGEPAPAEAGGVGGVASPEGGEQSAPAPAPSPGRPHPSIVLVLADDFSWDLVQYMPELKRMQAEGTTFTHFFVANSLCCPSRATIFAGQFPHNTGIYTNLGPDGGYAGAIAGDLGARMFGPVLQSAGYSTALLGKYLNGYDPKKNKAPAGWTDWVLGGYGYNEFNYDLRIGDAVEHHATAPEDYLTDVLAAHAGDLLEAATGPQFLELSTFAPHAPYIAAPRHAAQFTTLEYPRTPAFAARPSATDPAWVRAIPGLNANNITYIDRSYRLRARSVQAIDEALGALRAKLGPDAYLFFASDNGYHMGERSMKAGKRTPYDYDIRVPLIVVGPGVPAGAEVAEVTQTVDLFPTFAEIAGAPLPAHLDGRSLLPLLRGESPAWRTYALVEHHGGPYDPSDPDALDAELGGPPTYGALRSADTLYVEYDNGDLEYHDLRVDPHELENLAADLSATERAELHAKLAGLLACKAAECWASAR